MHPMQRLSHFVIFLVRLGSVNFWGGSALVWEFFLFTAFASWENVKRELSFSRTPARVAGEPEGLKGGKPAGQSSTVSKKQSRILRFASAANSLLFFKKVK